MKQKIMGAMEKFSKAMVQPLMYLSAAGILIVIGVLLTNSTITNFLPFLQWAPIQMLGKLASVNYFTAIGNVRQGIVLSLSRQGFFLIPLLLLLPLLFGLNGALYAGPIADSLACMLSLALVFRNFRELTAMRVQG